MACPHATIATQGREIEHRHSDSSITSASAMSSPDRLRVRSPYSALQAKRYVGRARRFTWRVRGALQAAAESPVVGTHNNSSDRCCVGYELADHKCC